MAGTTCFRRGLGKYSLLAALFFMLTLLPANSLAAGEFPIAAAGEQVGLFPAYDGVNYLVGIQGDGTSPTAVTAQLLAADGQPVGTPVQTGRSGLLPFPCFDGTNYLLIWEDLAASPQNDIYGMFINISGTPVGQSFPISTAPGLKTFYPGTRAIFDGTNYFVIWSNYTDLVSPPTVTGCFISRSGEVGRSFVIGQGVWPTMAFDGTNFLVAWAETDNRVYGRFVPMTGTLTTDKFLIDGSDNPSSRFIGAVFDGTRYAVSLEDDLSADTRGCYVRFVGKDGSVTADRVTIYEGKVFIACGVAAFDGRKYLALLSEGSGTPPVYAKARYYDTNFTPENGWFTLFSATTDNKVPLGPMVVFDQSKYLAVASLVEYTPNPAGFMAQFSQGSVYGKFIDPNQPPPADALDLTLARDGAAVMLTATVYSAGAPVPAKTILFYEQTGDAPPVKKGSARTDATGTAVKTFTSKPGSHSAFAKFAADAEIPETLSANVDYAIMKVSLVSPEYGAIVTTGTPTLAWNAFPEALLYRVQISTSASFRSGMREVTTTATSIAAPALDPGKLYYWRIIADIPTGRSLPSDARKISFKAAVGLVLGQPTVNGTTVSIRATLTLAETGAPVAGKTITFYEKTGDGAFVSKGRAKTGSLTSATPGVAVKTWKTIGGQHQAYAAFTGDNACAPQATDPTSVVYLSYSPVIFQPLPLPAACPGSPYYASVVTATTPSGGNGGPYHFELGTMGGFPPLGIILAPDGVLSGTVTGKTSKFTTCAVDTAGNSSCKPTSIIVRSDCSPGLTGTWVGTYRLAFNNILCDGGYVGYENGTATVYLQQVGTTVTGTILTRFNDSYCIANPTNRTGHLKGITLGSNGIDFKDIEISGFVLPSYFIYTRDFDIYVESGAVDFRLVVTKQ